MAILIGVLAPQYIKYVERSRVSSDKDMIDSLTKAAQTATTDDDYFDGINNADNITISKGAITVSGTSLSGAVDEFYGSLANNKGFKSKAFASTTITVEVTEDTSNGNILKVVVKDNSSNAVNGLYDASKYK